MLFSKNDEDLFHYCLLLTIIEMIKSIAYVCLMLAIQASLIPTQNMENFASAPPLKTIQQTLASSLNQPLNIAADAVDRTVLPSGSIDTVRQQHTALINNYFTNKVTSNVDQGVNNTIKGIHNVIQSGALNYVKGDTNILNGSSNTVNGSDNNVKGNQNTIISSDKNIVHGTGNVIIDEQSSKSVMIDTRIKPIIPKDTTVLPDYSKNAGGATVVDPTSKTNLSNQFESYFALGVFFIVLQLLL